jgi:hypothetical protein
MMPTATSTAGRPAALDRYSQVMAVRDALSVLLEKADLAELTGIDPSTPGNVGEADSALLALWPVETIEDEHARDASPEFQVASARSDVLAAKFLLRVADRADELREEAQVLLGIAQHRLAEKGGD